MGHGVNSREVPNRVVTRRDQKWPFSQPCQIRLAMIQSSLDLWFASQGHQEIQEIHHGHHGHHGKWFEEPSTIWHGNTMDIFFMKSWVELVSWISTIKKTIMCTCFLFWMGVGRVFHMFISMNSVRYVTQVVGTVLQTPSKDRAMYIYIIRMHTTWCIYVIWLLLVSVVHFNLFILYNIWFSYM